MTDTVPENEIEAIPLTLDQKMSSGAFDESDADERGWIFHKERLNDKETRDHMIPVKYWPAYEKLHGF